MSSPALRKSRYGASASRSQTVPILGKQQDEPGNKNNPSLRNRRLSHHRRNPKSEHDLEGPGEARIPINEEINPSSSQPGPRPGAMPRPVAGTSKLGTFDGVFVPTTLNVFSILMFLRFGFILGQAGVIGMMGMLIAAYAINLVTILSISAIATNGTVRGGGAYYLISRSLGPEFGGSIGVVLYLGFTFNTGMNAVGLIDCIKQNFGTLSGNWVHLLPESYWWNYLWSTVVLVICTAICLAGSGIFARASKGLLTILLISILSIPISTLFRGPFRDASLGIDFTGYSAETFASNLLPRFTRNAAGSQLHGKENFQDLFGILYPATAGILAGASMSGDLKHPSKAIPKGTLYGLALTFASYSVVILAMAATISRDTFYRDVNVIQDTNLSGIIILLGEFAASFFSTLMGVIGSAKLLQALARDKLIPGLSIFGYGTRNNDDPAIAIAATFVIAQLAMLCDINQIASLVTMALLMTFLVTNLACFLLKISSAPNFRPSFRYFNSRTAASGTLICGLSMFFVDGAYASGCFAVLVTIFLMIHYFTPPKSWGDVSQSLIYHQCRKYLLRLRQDHVKFWRPQILLFVNDPRRSYKLIQFCNALKKGGLFVIGHVIVSSDFGSSVPEARRQQAAWKKYVDLSKVKAFTNVAISPGVEWGTRNIVLSAGLGGMRPNIVIMGFYNLDVFRRKQILVDAPPMDFKDISKGSENDLKTKKRKRRGSRWDKMDGQLPTDENRPEGDVTPSNYVTILEDLLQGLQTNVAIAKGFQDLEFPDLKDDNSKKYIDLWPIQMSGEIDAVGDPTTQSVLTTNFDTYTLILQLGCILHTVPAWKHVYILRVIVFVEYESEVDEERRRVASLLYNLRIKAEVVVFWLASGGVQTYAAIVNDESGTIDKGIKEKVEKCLKDEDWWQDLQHFRGRRKDVGNGGIPAEAQNMLNSTPTWPNSPFRSGGSSQAGRFNELRHFVRKLSRSRSSGSMSMFTSNMTMTTQRLRDDILQHHASHASASEDSESADDDSNALLSSDEDDNDIPRALSNSETFSDGTESDVTRDVSRSSSLARGRRRYTEGGPTQDRPNALLLSPSPESTSPKRAVQKSLSRLASPEATEQISTNSNSFSHPSDQPFVPAAQPRIRPNTLQRSYTAKFSSRPVPETTIAPNDGPGPSIMFKEPITPDQTRPIRSIYDRSGPLPGPASGYPSSQSLPLSFNDLPCRAQHLILNELMQQQSAETAVIFTTLPNPKVGAGKDEIESVNYLTDLEVLCDGLPPVLLIHSNSLTVTMSL